MRYYIRCTGEIHSVELDERNDLLGALVLHDHPDLQGELILSHLGGADPPCLRFRRLWAAHLIDEVLMRNTVVTLLERYGFEVDPFNMVPGTLLLCREGNVPTSVPLRIPWTPLSYALAVARYPKGVLTYTDGSVLVVTGSHGVGPGTDALDTGTGNPEVIP